MGAALVVLVANGWGVWQAIQNRAAAEGGTLQLTERELPLQPVFLESSVTLLRLRWTADRSGNQRFGPVSWLDQAKLSELGFDCTVPLDSPRARRHYSSMAGRRVFLALQYQGERVWQSASQEPKTGLVVVDADRNPGRLRERYPDRTKYGICRGSVRLALRTHDNDGALLSPPRLEGRVEDLLPSLVSVPRPENRLLTTFHRTAPEGERARETEPRFSARVHWGKNYDPWIDEVQPLMVSTNAPGTSLTNRPASN